MTDALRVELQQLRAALAFQRDESDVRYQQAINAARGYAQRVTDLSALVAELDKVLA
jgi:hypothetical protein